MFLDNPEVTRIRFKINGENKKSPLPLYKAYNNFKIFQLLVLTSEAYSESCQTSKKKRFKKIVNCF